MVECVCVLIWIDRLQRERHALNALLRQPTIPRLDSLEHPATGSQPKTRRPSHKSTQNKRDNIDPSLLDPAQQAIFALLQIEPPKSRKEGDSSTSPATLPPCPPSAVSSRLSRITTGLAPTLDAFAAGVHDIELYRSRADAVSSRILRICAQRLEERDARNTQHRLAIEGSDGEQHLPTSPTDKPREDLGLILGALSRVERR